MYDFIIINKAGIVFRPLWTKSERHLNGDKEKFIVTTLFTLKI